MRADYETYEKVAEHCSEFAPESDKDSFHASSQDKEKVSCTNCKHFDEDKFCKLDLYDKIISNHNFK